jgi:hypothetical protein
MGKYSVGAQLKKGKEITCKWKGCDSPVHDYKIEYPGGGIVSRGKYTGEWTEPHAVPYRQVSKKEFHVIRATKKRSYPDSYKLRFHHVIPVAVMKKNIPNIKANLKLLGWDMNSGSNNGICLPFYNEDISWHDLPAHRGSHPTYNSNVAEALSNLNGKCKEFCKKNQQDKLEKEIETKVKNFKKNIVRWVWPMHDDSQLYRI